MADLKNKKKSPLDVIRSPRFALRQNWTLVKFAIVGASGVLVNLGLLTLLTDLFGNGLILIFNGVAVEASILNNFVWNDRFTFGGGAKGIHHGRLARLAKYNLLSLVSFAVNEVVFSFLYSLGLYKYWASLIAIGFSFLVNYFGSSRWAWRHSWLSSNSVIAKPAASDSK
ncbi:MAG: GtrA family protein [Nitrososphaerales archaeon]